MYYADIREVATGRERTVVMDLEWDDEGSWYWWGEGSFSCDCNRRRTFYRNDENPPPDDDEFHKCGDGGFLVRIRLEDGEVTLDEWEHGHGYWP